MRRRAPIALSATSVLVALVFATPLAYLISRVAVGDVRMSSGVSDDRVQDALWRTIVLASLVAVSAALIGPALAWLVARSDVPYRRVVAVPVPLPPPLPAFRRRLALP